MKLNVFLSVNKLNDSLVNYVVKCANRAISEKGRFNFVLTGGNSPKELYRQLGTTYKDKIDWSKVYFFFGDERNVAPDHKDYNGLMAKENLFDLLETAEDHIFYINTRVSPQEAAEQYFSSIKDHFGSQDIKFDLVLLGMGDDAHTASIFPDTDLVTATEKTVAAVWVEKLNTFRISLTAPLINEAEQIAFITFGENKSTALMHVIGDKIKNYAKYPAQLIQPTSDQLEWFVDELAASKLK